MIRRMLVAASVVSLMLAAANLAAWVRSYAVQDAFRRTRYEPSRQTRTDEVIMSSKGSLWWSMLHETGSPVAYIYYMGDDRLMGEGDISLPWRYQRGYFNRTYLNTPEEPQGLWETLGIFSSKSVQTRRLPSAQIVSLADRGTTFQLRYWTLEAIFLALPLSGTVALIRRRSRSRRRHARQQCPACGYDLRGSSGRCPECGTPIHSHERADA